MNSKTKIIIACAGILAVCAVVYVISENKKRKKYNETIVPPDYALSLIDKSDK